MGIDGSDARIQIQKISDVDQIDKQHQEGQRGEIGAAREKAEAERERRKTQPNEMQRPDKAIVSNTPYRKRRQHPDEEESDEETDEEPQAGKSAEPVKDVGGTLDVKG